MFYEGVPLYPFGHGLSYTSFSLRWAARGNLSVTLDLDSPHFVSDFAQRSFALEVTNTGKRFGRETVMAFWVPHAALDQLKQQLFNLLVTAFCQLDLAGFLINGEVTGRLSFLRHFALFEVGDQFIDGLIKL